MALALVAGQVAGISSAYAQDPLPQGGTVTSGTASIAAPANGSLLVDQSSQYAIIEWDGFSIGADNAVAFANGDGATLNRVTGDNLSEIHGSLTATGSLFLINQNGIIVGEDGVVETGGDFVAATRDLSDADFLDGGDNTFSGASTGSVVNLGQVGSLGGNVGIIAHTIVNEGMITAPDGTVGLAVGREVLMRDASLDDGMFYVSVGDADSEITEAGSIAAAEVELRANGGNIYALAGNNDGEINATGVENRGGRIFLTAPGGSITTTKTVRARKAPSGGSQDGGIIFANADFVSVGGLLDASGLDGGTGGFIETSGDDFDFTGAQITPGAGGEWLIDPIDLVIGAVAAGNIVGVLNSGADVTLETDDTSPVNPPSGSIVGTGFEGDIYINAAIVWTGIGNLIIDAYDDFIVNAEINGVNGGLIIDAADEIVASADITVGTYIQNVGAWSQVGALPAFQADNFTLNGGSFLRAAGGDGTSGTPYQIADIFGLQGIGSTTAMLGANYVLANTIDASGTANWNGGAGFDPIGAYLDGFTGAFDGAGFSIEGLTINRPAEDYVGLFSYAEDAALANLRLIDGSVTGLSYVGGLVGRAWAQAGTLTISEIETDLTVHGVGIIVGGVAGMVGNFSAGPVATLILSNVSADGASSSDLGYAGGLVGSVRGGGGSLSELSGLSATGTVSGPTVIGGLFGQVISTSSGTELSLTDATASGAVSSTGSHIGGLIGLLDINNGASVDAEDVHATGDVSGDWYVGGLIGYLTGGTSGVASVSQSSAEGTVSATSQYGGGLMGRAYLYSSAQLDVEGVFATGNVSASANHAGGLFGGLEVNGGLTPTVSGAYATGDVTSTSGRAGGLFGTLGWSDVSNSYATGDVSGGYQVGGFAGYVLNSVMQGVHATGDVVGSVNDIGGLIGHAQAATGVMTLTEASASGQVTGGAFGKTGGLIGYFEVDANGTGTVSDTWATGDVSSQSSVAGGLIGEANSTGVSAVLQVTRSWATGDVTTTDDNVGGLIGFVIAEAGGTAEVVKAYATGSASGSNNAGGLVGYLLAEDDGDVLVQQTYALGGVSSISHGGGLVGRALSNGAPGILIDESYATGAVDTVTLAGGLVGELLTAGPGDAILQRSFWDIQTTYQISSIGNPGGGTENDNFGVATSGAMNPFAYTPAPYSWSVGTTLGNALPATDWLMIEGETRPFGAWEFSTEIRNAHQLQLINFDLDNDYVLVGDVDASWTDALDPSGMWSSDGFVPLGTDGNGSVISNGFTGSLDGQGHTIAGLTISRLGTANVGLFGEARDATIGNLNLVGGAVSGAQGTGALVGHARASLGVLNIHDVTSDLDVTADSIMVGGLIGRISQENVSSSTTFFLTDLAVSGVVTATSDHAGGLVGYFGTAIGTVTEFTGLSFSGDLTGRRNAGGLFGYASAHGDDTLVTLMGASVSGSVQGSDYVGGLIGRAESNYDSVFEISDVAVTGAVSGASYVGGLVGYSTQFDADSRTGISTAQVTGDVTANFTYAGGLIGYSLAVGEVTISASNAQGQVSGSGYVGGLAGLVQTNVAGSYFVSDSWATGNIIANGGRAGGLIGQITSNGSDAEVIVETSWASGNVSASGGYVGGLIGYDFAVAGGSSTLRDVFASGDVAGQNNVGGLVGINQSVDGGTAYIQRAYALGDVSAVDSAGGLVGYNSVNGNNAAAAAAISQAYATGRVVGMGDYVGGLVGRHQVALVGTGVIQDSFWDTETTGQANAVGTTQGTAAEIDNYGLTTAEAFDSTSYGSWTIGTAMGNALPPGEWLMIDGETRPFGAWEHSTEIANAHQLQLMAFDLDADYTLVADIDASGTDGTNASEMWGMNGFAPVGRDTSVGDLTFTGTTFSGSLDGAGHTISDLTVFRPDEHYVGLFGNASGADFTGLRFEGSFIEGNRQVGTLAGSVSLSFGTATIESILSSGEVRGDTNVGGLLGIASLYGGVLQVSNLQSSGIVKADSSAGGIAGHVDYLGGGALELLNFTSAVDVTANGERAGGIVGLLRNNGGASVELSGWRASGSVMGDGFVGGVVGDIELSSVGTVSITGASATGDVSAVDDAAGGLIGRAYIVSTSASAFTVEQSWASGSVSGRHAGGLAGQILAAAGATLISQTYSTGDVTGLSGTGGLVAALATSGPAAWIRLEKSYASGAATGGIGHTGALVGVADENSMGTIEIAQNYATGSVSGAGAVGGLVGHSSGASFIDNFFDTTTTGTLCPVGTNSCAGVTGITGHITPQMLNASLYAIWDIGTATGTVVPEGDWLMIDGETRPFGAWEYSTLIENAHQLQLAAFNLDADYVLGNDIDASATDATNPADMWGANGFVPIGIDPATGNALPVGDGFGFSGTFDGMGYAVADLYVDRTTNRSALFGQVDATGTVSRVGLEDADITGGAWVGGLVGVLFGSVEESWSDGTISAESNVGGLVGYSEGEVSGSSATGEVYATNGGNAGGLVGRVQGGSVSQSWANTTVDASGDSVGGLVGWLSGGSLYEVYAKGTVSGRNNIGGLAGYVSAGTSIMRAYATASATGGDTGTGSPFGQEVGGLVGQNFGDISESWASGAVSGSANVGGFVGKNNAGGTVASSYWDTSTGGGTGIGLDLGTSTLGGWDTANSMIAANYSGWSVGTPTVDGNSVPDTDWLMIEGETRLFGAWEYDTQIAGLHQLQLMAFDLDADYAITRDIDASPTDGSNASDMWTGAGFVPVGYDESVGTSAFNSTPFTGMFDGQGHVIDALTIDRADEHFVGLFGQALDAQITDVVLQDVDLTGDSYVGSLAGHFLVGLGGDLSVSGITTGGSVGAVSSGGGLAGAVFSYANGAHIAISDIDTNVEVSVSNFHAGGAIGYSNVSGIGTRYRMWDIATAGPVSASSNNAGGVQGYLSGTGTGSLFVWSDIDAQTDVEAFSNYAGGVIGFASLSAYTEGQILDADTSGTVDAVYGAGGHVGGVAMGTRSVFTLADSSSSGDISVTAGYGGGAIGEYNSSSDGLAVHLQNVTTSGDIQGPGLVGGLLGWFYSGGAETSTIVEGSSASGIATGTAGTGSVGGLIGSMHVGPGTADIHDSFATGDVYSAGSSFGGLVGSANTSGGVVAFTDVWASGDVTGTTSSTHNAGGLFGQFQVSGNGASFTLENASATGAVTGDGDAYGGLVGFISAASSGTASVRDSQASGNVTADRGDVGGLIGALYATEGVAEVLRSHASGSVAGSDSVGGFVGYVYSENMTDIDQSYATGAVYGGTAVGGFVGTVEGYDGTVAITDIFAGGPVHGGTDVGGMFGATETFGTGQVSFGDGFVYGNVFGGTNVGGIGGRGAPNGGGISVGNLLYDSQTTGQTVAYGAGLVDQPLGRTTAQLKADLNVSWDTAIWSILPDESYPYLQWRFPTGPSVIDGTVAGVAGGNQALGVGIAGDGVDLGMTYTGANGAYYFATDPLGTAMVTWLDGTRHYDTTVAERGNAVMATDTNGHAHGMDIDAGWVRAYSGLTSMSLVETDLLAAAIDGLTDPNILYEVTGDLTPDSGVGFRLDSSAAAFGYNENYSHDGAFWLIGAGDMTLQAGATLTSSAVGDAVVISTASIFINGAGSGALTASDANGRWLVYSAAPGANTFGGLDSSSVGIWGQTFDSLPPASVAAGNRYVFAEAATLTFTTTDLTKTYGDVPDLTGAFNVTTNATGVAGAFDGIDPNSAYGGVTSVTSDGQAANASVAGSPYAISIDISAVTSAYGLNVANTGTLTVNPLAITITPDVGQSKVYGAVDPTLTYSTSVSLVTGDTFNGDLVRALGENVGTYAFDSGSLEIIDGNGGNNYQFNFDDLGRTFAITPATLTITAEDRTKTYGSTLVYGDVPGTDFSVAGLQFTDTVTGVDLASGGTGASDNVGDYTITISDATGFDAGNYDVVYETGTLTVNPLAITVSPADGQGKVYGEDDPLAFAVESSVPLVTGDEFTGNLVRVSGQDVGTYALGVGDLDIDDGNGGQNYDLSFADLGRAFTITPAALMITALDLEKTYDGVPFAGGNGVSYLGFVNGDDATDLGGSLDYAGTSQGAVDAGDYLITPLGLTSTNYTISFVDGTLTIVGAPVEAINGGLDDGLGPLFNLPPEEQCLVFPVEPDPECPQILVELPEFAMSGAPESGNGAV